MITNPGAAGAVVVAAHVTRSAAYKETTGGLCSGTGTGTACG